MIELIGSFAVGVVVGGGIVKVMTKSVLEVVKEIPVKEVQEVKTLKTKVSTLELEVSNCKTNTLQDTEKLTTLNLELASTSNNLKLVTAQLQKGTDMTRVIDKLSAFNKTFTIAERSLTTAYKAMEKARGQLTEGRGNLTGLVDK